MNIADVAGWSSLQIITIGNQSFICVIVDDYSQNVLFVYIDKWHIYHYDVDFYSLEIILQYMMDPPIKEA